MEREIHIRHPRDRVARLFSFSAQTQAIYDAEYGGSRSKGEMEKYETPAD